MTAIAAIAKGGRVYMAGDSAAVGQSHYLSLAATPKVFEVGPLVIGYTSSFRMGYALQHRLELPDGLPDGESLIALDRWMAVDFIDAVRQLMTAVGHMRKDCDREQGGVFLVGVRGRIYECDDDYHARRVGHDYYACGSGVSVCLGALKAAEILAPDADPSDVLVAALRAASAHVTSVSSPFPVISGGAQAERVAA